MPSEAAENPCVARAEAPVESGGTAYTIDDDPLMAELLERRLRRHGVEPVRFDDPKRLLDTLRDSPPEFFFTDLEMPLMHGAELIARARSRGFCGTIVVVTASRERGDLVAAIASGADEILAKPVQDCDLDILFAKARERSRRPLDTMELLRAALEPVNQGVIFLDEECVPFYANSRARQILEAASTSEVHEVLERGGLAAHIMGERGEQEGVFFIDVAKAGAAKAPLLVGFEARELSPISRGRAYLVLMHDFSEWRKLDELHSRFATYLSHRMRTPLTSARNAVTILSGKDQPLEGADRERFLEIGCRNIEKLISSFDELQKVFMVESGEINAYRSLVRVGRELGAILGECERSGLIRGFKLRAPDCTAITCRSRLKEYVLNTVEAMASWLGEVPHVDCTVADTGTVDEGVEEPALFVSLVPRGRPGGGPALKDYLALEAVQRRFVLERIARALDGVHTIAGNDTFKLRLPAAPPFDRERDLIHPLHMMLERSELERSAFHLVSMRLGGAVPDAPRFTRLLEANLCALFGKDDWVVAREEAPERFALFVTGASREGIDEAMEILRERFAHCCRERGEEIYPTVRWEISYSREPGACSDSPERAVLEALI